MKEIVEVAVALPVSKTFHYRIPFTAGYQITISIRWER